MHSLIITFLVLGFLPILLTNRLSKQNFNLVKIGKKHSVNVMFRKNIFN